ncbi:MAG: hypothetical protein ABIB04_00035 [Patescibacteria group bacterium]
MVRKLTGEESKKVLYCQELREILLDERWDIEALERICAFAEKLRTRYPVSQIMSCTLYHIMIGSTMSREAERFDFSGFDSIVLFLENLAAQFDPARFLVVKSEWR